MEIFKEAKPGENLKRILNPNFGNDFPILFILTCAK